MDVGKDLLKDDFEWVRHIGGDYFGPTRDKTLGTPQGIKFAFHIICDDDDDHDDDE